MGQDCDSQCIHMGDTIPFPEVKARLSELAESGSSFDVNNRSAQVVDDGEQSDGEDDPDRDPHRNERGEGGS